MLRSPIIAHVVRRAAHRRLRRIVEAVLGDAYQEALGGEVHWNDFNSVTDAWTKFLAYLESVEGSAN